MVHIIACEGLPSANKDAVCDVLERRFNTRWHRNISSRNEPCHDNCMFSTLFQHLVTIRRPPECGVCVLRDWVTCMSDPLLQTLYDECKTRLLTGLGIHVQTEVVVIVQSNIHDSMMYVMSQPDEAYKDLGLGDIMSMFDALERRKQGKTSICIKTPSFMSDNSFEHRITLQTIMNFIEKHVPIPRTTSDGGAHGLS